MLRRRLRSGVPTFILAATIYVPLLFTRPGRVGADTKTYLYLDPGLLLRRATSMWDPGIGLGTVTHQNIGYLWPIGPYYWAAEALGLPDWVAQRIWTGTILFLAGLGVRFMLKAMGQEGPHVTAATFIYALTPYALTLGSRLSVILLPYTGLPWLIGLTVLALRRRRWREPALFALVVTTIGTVNATALLLVGLAPVLWLAHEVAIGDARARDALATAARIGVLTTACSLWWVSGLWVQGSYGINILRYTETAQTVASAAVAVEVMRGLGYWFFYGEDRFGPWISSSVAYMRRLDILVVTYLLPILGLVGLAAARFRERTYFGVLLALGLVLAVGPHPWDRPTPAGAAIKAFLESEYGLAMRSLPRATPLVALSLAVLCGALIASIAARTPPLGRPLTAGVIVLSLLGMAPLWRFDLVDANLDRNEELPGYWLEAAQFLDGRDHRTRVLEVPGTDFASYRWGNTVDPVLPGLMERPYVARELIPYGSAASADLIDAFDHQMQEGTLDAAAVAPIARFMAAGDISVRSDLTYERFNTPRPRLLWDLLTGAEGLSVAGRFGTDVINRPRPDLPMQDEAELLTPPGLADPPAVGVLEVTDAEPIVHTGSVGDTQVLAGSGEGLVNTAAAGLLTGHETVLYSASFAGDPAELRRIAGADAPLVLTDTNRRAGQRWGTVRDNHGETERAGQTPIRPDPKDQRLPLFADAGDEAATVIESRGDVAASATSYGNIVSLTPEDRASNAVDGQAGTAWSTGGFSTAIGETLRLDYRSPVTTDRIRLLQVINPTSNRHISRVAISFDGGDPISFDLDESSRPDPVSDVLAAGQVVTFPSTTFSRLELTIVDTDPGRRPRYDNLSAVGLAEVTVIGNDGSRPLADDVTRLPTDLLDIFADSALTHPLAVVLTRLRVPGTVAVRTSPEGSMARTFSLPQARSFYLGGQVRLSTAAISDHTIDQALGLADADHGGVTATSSRRLPGGLNTRSMAAIDGDLSTWYSPGYLDQGGEYIDFVNSEPLTFSRFGLTVINDGRHSVPRRISLEVDGRADPDLVFDLPEVPDQSRAGAHHTFELELPEEVTGRQVRVVVVKSPGDPDATVRRVTTLDWYSGDPITMPIGIAELDIDGLRAPALPDQLDPACRDDLVELNGSPLSVTLSGSTQDLLAGRPVDIAVCDEGSVALPAGSSTLRTAAGTWTGFDLDRLSLQSAAGGAGGRALPGARGDSEGASDSERPSAEVTAQDRTALDVTMPARQEPTWLILGQSHNLGWTASIDGTDLGEPYLVNGFANAWLIPPGAEVEVALRWTPQRVVDLALVTSAAAVALCLMLALRRGSGRSAGPTADIWIPLDRRPSMPLALDTDRIWRYVGPMPSRFAVLATTAGAGLLGWAFVGAIGGGVLVICSISCLRLPRARPLLTIGGPLLFAASVGWVLVQQLFRELPSGFDWPTYFEAGHQPTLLGVALLTLDLVVDRCWLRRWWPTEDSPS